MLFANRILRNVVLLPAGAIVALVVLSNCGRERNQPDVGGADITMRSLGALNLGNVTATVSGPALASPENFPLFARDGGTWGGTIGSLPVGGNYVLTVSATDQSNAIAYAGTASGIVIVKDQTKTVVITAQQITAVASFENAVPVIDSVVLSSTSVVPGTTITAKATAHDPNPGDSIAFAWSVIPAVDGFSAPSAAATTWTAPASEGDQTLIVTVTDNHGASTSASTVINISASNGRGQADVNVRFNTWPVVANVAAAPGYLVPGSPTTVSVTASDGDGDTLFYGWTSSCASGSLTSATSQSVSFTVPTGATDASCDIIVAINDGRGGSTTGQLTLPVGKPPIITPPIITAKVQSDPLVDANGSVNFAVWATDPENTALTFLWVATDGVFSYQVDGVGSSQVIWTAPATPNAAFTVSVMVSDAVGARVQSDFTVSTTAGSGPDGGSACECSGMGPGNVPVTVACGQSTCGSDNLTYACGASGWSAPGQPCDVPDAGACECSGMGPGNVPVTVACGQSTCGSDNLTYACGASGWSAPGQPCDVPDAGACECSGMGPGNVPVTVACGQSTCGSDNLTYACGASGWSAPGQPCNVPDAGACECSGMGPGNVPVTVACGQSTCGSDNLTYACGASGWSSAGAPCR